MLVFSVATVVIFTFLFRPSYTYLPKHYKALRRSCLESSEPGRGNVHGEKVFIATTLRDPGGKLVGGEWGKAILELVDLLGPSNVYLSVYENDSDMAANVSLNNLINSATCNASVVSEHFPLEEFPHIKVPTGEERIKRIAFLAEVRNRALRPLQTAVIAYDRLLYINDIIFDPIDAVQLLFSTNIDVNGRAQYGAACGVDFINPFRFYDWFATRDFEGYEMGVPFFPWFTDAGDGISRQDVLDQKDAVRVRSCWGGMTAFEAKWFQRLKQENPGNSSALSLDLNVSPLRFRYEADTFWDASECCLIHADLTYLRHENKNESGIFTNPYVRVAYDSRTLSWLPFSRRFERLYPLIHNFLNHRMGLPVINVRRLEQPGDNVTEKVWVWDEEMKHGDSTMGDGRISDARVGLGGSYHDVKRIARPGRFCGGRALLVKNVNPKPGEGEWEGLPIPVLPD